MSELAGTAYRNSGFSPSLELLTSDEPADVLHQAAAIDRLSRRQQDSLQQMVVARQRLAEARVATEQEAAGLAEVESRLQAEKRQVEQHLADAERLLATLKAEERERLERQRREAAERARREAAERARELAAEQARAERAERAERARSERAERARGERTRRSTRAGGGSRRADPKPDGGVSTPHGAGGAATAVRVALAQVGDRYVYGAGGPDAFDCSGLTSFAWRAAGVSLPHSSQMQYAVGRKVSRSALQPGDLVFYYSPISHVGIYIGGGRIVHAANPRKPVNIASVDSMPFAGAARP